MSKFHPQDRVIVTYPQRQPLYGTVKHQLETLYAVQFDDGPILWVAESVMTLIPSLPLSIERVTQLHYMIDIETEDTTPTALILSIGVVYFDPLTHTISEDTFYRNIDPESCRQHGLTSSQASLFWWANRSPEAHNSLTDNRVVLQQALIDLADYIAPNSKVWAHSPSFDLVILENAYRAIGRAVPWSYQNARDTRTLFDITSIDLKDFILGIRHNALDDAMSQTRAVCESYRRLGYRRKVRHATPYSPDHPRSDSHSA